MDDLRFLDPEALVNRAAFNERFGLLNEIMFGLGNQYLWEKTKVVESYEYDEADSSSGVNLVTTNTSGGYVSYGTGFTVSNGKFVLTGVSGKNFVFPDYDTSVLKGKYIKQTLNGVEQETIYYIDPSSSDPSVTYDTFVLRTGSVGKVYNNIQIKTSTKSFGYVNSSSPDAYPPAEPDGYTYTALGQLGNKVQIETGSYTGTGTYGVGNENSLTFRFVPKLVVITGVNGSGHTGPAQNIIQFFLNGFEDNYWYPYGFLYNSAVEDTFRAKLTANTLYWTGETATIQCNYNNVTYYYIAIG